MPFQTVSRSKIPFSTTINIMLNLASTLNNVDYSQAMSLYNSNQTLPVHLTVNPRYGKTLKKKNFKKYRVERENCRPRKDDIIPFTFNENRFSFSVADHRLVGQLCTNSNSDRNLLSCLKVTQCSTNDIGDASLYNSRSLPIQVMTTGPLPGPSKYHE